jgi:hypothetical protein
VDRSQPGRRLHARQRERGVKARTAIPAGKIVGIYGGEVHQYKLVGGRITDPAAAREAVQLAVEGDTVFAMVTPDGGEFGGVDYLNHSCRPNLAVRRAPIIVATARAVEADEELTANYLDWDEVHYRQPCWCPVPRRQPRCVI